MHKIFEHTSILIANEIKIKNCNISFKISRLIHKILVINRKTYIKTKYTLKLKYF